MRPSRALYLDSYVASATLEGLFQLKRKSDKIFTVFTVSAAQNSTETVNSVLKLAAPHCSLGKASSKFVRLCCCGAGCLVNYSCLCQCCRSLPIQCCLLAIRWTFVKVLNNFVDLSRPFSKVALRGRFSQPRGHRGRPTQSQQILHVPKSLRHPRHSDPIPR